MNKVKKIIAVIMVIVCVVNNCNIIAKAGEPTLGTISICYSDGEIQDFAVLVEDEKIYMSVVDISKVIGFTYSIGTESICYEASNGTRCIKIFYDGFTIANSGVCSENWDIKLLEYGEDFFLPLEELLYLSYATWCVDNGVIYVSHAGYNVLDFLEENYFDMMMNQNELEDILLNGEGRWGRTIRSTLAHALDNFNIGYFVPWFGGYYMDVDEFEELFMLLVEDDRDFIEDVGQLQIENMLNPGVLNEFSNDANLMGFITSIPKEYKNISDILTSCSKSDEYHVAKKIMDVVDLSELNSVELEALNAKIGKVSDAANIVIAISNIVKSASWAERMGEDFLDCLSVIGSADKERYASVSDAAIDAANNLIERKKDSFSAIADDCMMEAINIMGMKALEVFVSPVALFITAIQIGNNVLQLSSKYATEIDTAKLSYIANQMLCIEDVAELETELKYICLSGNMNVGSADIKNMRATILLYLQSNLRTKCLIYELNRIGSETENWEQSKEAALLKEEMAKDYAWIIELKSTAEMDKRLVLESFESMYTSGDGITREKITMDVIHESNIVSGTLGHEKNPEVFALFQEAVSKLVENGSWCEQINMTINQELSTDDLKQRSKQEWEMISYIYDYKQEKPYEFTMKSTATMNVLNLTYGWDFTYTNGQVQGKMNMPFGVSETTEVTETVINQKVDLSAFQLDYQLDEITPIDARRNNDTLYFTIKSEDMNRFYSSMNNELLQRYDVSYNDTDFTVKINPENGSVSSILMEMEYSLVIDGYNIKEDAVVEYQYSLI